MIGLDTLLARFHPRTLEQDAAAAIARVRDQAVALANEIDHAVPDSPLKELLVRDLEGVVHHAVSLIAKPDTPTGCCKDTGTPPPASTPLPAIVPPPDAAPAPGLPLEPGGAGADPAAGAATGETAPAAQ